MWKIEYDTRVSATYELVLVELTRVRQSRSSHTSIVLYYSISKNAETRIYKIHRDVNPNGKAVFGDGVKWKCKIVRNLTMSHRPSIRANYSCNDIGKFEIWKGNTYLYVPFSYVYAGTRNYEIRLIILWTDSLYISVSITRAQDCDAQFIILF